MSNKQSGSLDALKNNAKSPTTNNAEGFKLLKTLTQKFHTDIQKHLEETDEIITDLKQQSAITWGRIGW